MSYPTDLTDEQWAILEPLLQRADGPGRPTELDLRTVVNALLYKNSNQLPMAHAAERFSTP
jgi:putative transposase